MGATYSKREKKNRVYYRFVKPWRHEGSSNNSRSTGRHEQPTLCASELSEDDIWHRGRASDAKCLDETYSVYQGLVKSENVEICRETVLNGFEYTYIEDKETEEYTSNDFQLGNKHKNRPPTHFPHLVHLKNEGVVEREVVVEEQEMYEEPDFTHFNDYPGDSQDIQVQFLQLQFGNKNKNRPQMPLPHQSNLEDKSVVVVADEEEEMYEEQNFKHFNVNIDNIQDLQLLLGNKYKKLPPIPVHHQSNLKDERVVVLEEEEDKEEMFEYYEPPDFKHCNVYPGNIRDITDESVSTGDFRDVTSPDTPKRLSVAGEFEEIFHKSDTQEVSRDESCNANTNVEAQSPQPPQLEQTQVVDEVNITDTEEEEAPPLPIRAVGRRHRYEETIILHRQIIVRDVIVSQVLPHLHMCLSSSDISAIKGENDQHKAVELLLDKLSACKEPGKWKMFVQALEECKHKAIVDALRRKCSPDNNELGKFLHIFSLQLREMIVPSEITAELLRTDVINSDDRDEMHQKERSAGTVAAADVLLDRIPRKHPDWFGKFISALRIIGRHDLVDMLTEGNDMHSHIANQEEEGCVSSNERPDTTKCKSTFKYGSPVLGNEQQTTYQSAEYDENTESKALEYSEAYGVLEENKKIQEHCNPDDETLEKKTMKADENVQQSKRKIKYTPVVINGQICTVKDESATEEWTPPIGEIPKYETNRESSLSGCILLTEAQSKNIQLLRENKKALSAEGNALELEIMEYEDILNAHEKNNKLLNKKRSFCEQIKLKEKEATALKAAISGEDIEEDKFRYQSAASLEDMAQYIAPGRRPMTWDFRDTDVSATIIPSRIPIDIGITMPPVKLYDVDQTYKDSAFYSEC